MMIRTATFRFAVTLIALSVAHTNRAAELPPAADRKIDYTRDVKPILAKHCFACHADKKQESGFRLDRRDGLLAGGDLGKVLVAGKSAESRLIHLVAATDPKNVMPPEGAPLSAEAVGILRAWIDQGANYPADEVALPTKSTHWAYQPLRAGPIPAVAQANWPVNPIDRFVLAQLEKKGLGPSPEANRYTLIRRLSLDLTGLLPTIAEVDAFVGDKSANAYEALVDRLLASPHFGERWGRHWLDMARYADSDGYEKDNARPDAYRYRDWVIDAINADIPFDQFTIEQLAGDLLPNATPMQKLATAFHRQTLTNTEGGTDQEQFRVEACFDRTETTGSVWLGLTIGCARCHSHKYDAISQREYYQIFAVFNNGDEAVTVVPKSADEVTAYEKRKAEHAAALGVANAKLRTARAKVASQFVAWLERTQTEQADAIARPLKFHPLTEPRFDSDGDVTFTPQKEDGSVLVSGKNPLQVTYTITGGTTASELTGLKLEALADKSLAAKGPGRSTHGNFVLNDVTLEVSSTADFAEPRLIPLAAAKADFEQGGEKWTASGAIDGDPTTGWAISPQFGKDHTLSVRFKEPIVFEGTLHVRVRLAQTYGTQHTLGRFKLSLHTGIEPTIVLPEPVIKVLAVAPDKRTAEQGDLLLDHFISLDSSTKELLTQRDELAKKEPPKPELPVRVFTQRTANPRKTFVLKRGEFLEPLKDVDVAPAGLATLPPLVGRREGADADRLDLARWLVSVDNPLTPRVTVNHVWRLLFGNGFVRTPNDFGVRGERPSHPELLDWLAADFIGKSDAPTVPESATSPNGVNGSHRGPWSRKALIKRIVMSATYRQSSRHRPEVSEVDPQNVGLSRQNRLRVEGELVRDISLDVAGLLSKKVGGPSVYPPLPPGIAELSYAGNFKWTPSTGDDRYRRGMYTFFKRTAPHPNLTTFDCPDANIACLERRTSNTPLQALTALNNESFTEASRALAKRLLGGPAVDDRERLAEAYRLCVAHLASDGTLRELLELLQTARDWYREHPEEAKKLIGPFAAPNTPTDLNAAWVVTSRILLNTDEFITRE